MYARLNLAYGWFWKENGFLVPFILTDAERYAGMLTGWNQDGRKCARPVNEVEALSLDGELWLPTKDLLAQVPWESRNNVRIRDLPLPVAFDEDR